MKRLMVTLAHTAGKPGAGDIETEAQNLFARDCGCRYSQGFPSVSQFRVGERIRRSILREEMV